MSEEDSANLPAAIEPETAEQALVFVDAARRALDKALDFQSVRHCRSMAVAAAAYAREAKDSTLIERATRLRVLAERRAGEMLRDGKETGDLYEHGGNRKSTSEAERMKPKLADMGITFDQASQWQRLAELSQGEFDDAVNAVAAGSGTVSAARVLATAIASKPPPPRADNGKRRKSHAESAAAHKRSVLDAIEAATPATPIVTYAKSLRRLIEAADKFTDAELMTLAELRQAIDEARER